MLSLDALIESKRAFGKTICERMTQSILKQGFAADAAMRLPDFDALQFKGVVDPFSQHQDLIGYWLGKHQEKLGQLQFQEHGQFYAEFDVALPHPKKDGFFVEAVHAWGNADNIKTEAKLLEIPQ